MQGTCWGPSYQKVALCEKVFELQIEQKSFFFPPILEFISEFAIILHAPQLHPNPDILPYPGN